MEQTTTSSSAAASRKRKNNEDALNAGFKKALVSSTAASAIYENGLGDLNSLGSNAPSHGNTDAHTGTTHPNAQDTTPVGSHGSISDLSMDDATATSSDEVAAASAVVMTTMADLLANARDGGAGLMGHANQTQHQHHRHDQNHQNEEQQQQHSMNGGVSEEVIRMQQDLQQQIPLSPTTNTRLTREQIIESIASIPDMQMLIEESLKENLANANSDVASAMEHHRSTTNTPRSGEAETETASAAEDASKVLAHLGDSSILATSSVIASLKRNVSLYQPPLPGSHNGEGSQAAADTNETMADNQETDPGSSTSDIKIPAIVDAVTSDNPLHTKWLMATALKEKGIPYKTGTFSSHEDDLIRQTIKDYVTRNSMPEDAIQRWFQNGNGRGRFEKNDLKALWVEIAVRLQNRPLLNIYLHVRRMFHPQNNVGAWSKDDDERLVMLYAKHKGQWTTIGTELGRMADSCRDRYRNHLKDQSTMVTGPWQPHEDEKLLSIMQDLALQQGKANILDSSPMWTLISERMQGTRTRHQCRHRYSQTLQPRLERGEWTAPSSAAAAAAAAVAANAAVAAEATSSTTGQQQQSQQQQQTLELSSDLGLTLGPSHEHEKSTAAQDVLMLAAALQGVLPTDGNGNSMLWTQAISNNLHDSDHNSFQEAGDNHLSGDVHQSQHDPFSAVAFTSSLPLASIVPKAPKGPIRRRSGLQQQLDVIKMIQEDGYTDHTDIKWADIAQRLRDRVEEANAIQLARIIQTHDRLDSKMQQHLQDNDGTAAATAAASAAMAAAVSAAQAEAVASLQRVPAANQIVRTFMSSRCKIEGYKEMTLQQVIVPMMKDVERRIQHRRGASNSQSTNGSGSANEGSSSKSTRSNASSSVLIQQQEISDAAQQAAIAALSAQFPFLQQHHHQSQQSALAQALSGSASVDHQHHHSEMHQLSSDGMDISTSSTGEGQQNQQYAHHHEHDSHRHHAHGSSTAQSATSGSFEEQQHLQAVQHQQELEQQQHNRDLAEQMLQMAFSATDMSNMFDSLASFSSSAVPSVSSTASSSPLSSSSGAGLGTEASASVVEFSMVDAVRRQKQATRRVLDALQASAGPSTSLGDSYVPESSDDDDDDDRE